MKVEDIEYAELIEKVKETLTEMKLQVLDPQADPLPCPSQCVSCRTHHVFLSMTREGRSPFHWPC